MLYLTTKGILPEYFTNLKPNKKYLLISEDRSGYWVKGENGRRAWGLKKRFIVPLQCTLSKEELLG